MIYFLKGGIIGPPTSIAVPRLKNIWQSSATSMISLLEMQSQPQRKNFEILRSMRSISRDKAEMHGPHYEYQKFAPPQLDLNTLIFSRTSPEYLQSSNLHSKTFFQLSVLPFAIMATTVDKVKTVFVELRISYANNPPQIKDIEAEVCCSP